MPAKLPETVYIPKGNIINGVKRQKWETFATNAEAKKRKVQVEFEQETGT